jgi:hypothetical protein
LNPARIMNTPLAWLALSALLAAGAPSGQASDNPIKISSCVVNLPRAGDDWVDPWGVRYYQPSTRGNVNVTFENLGSKTASSIDFGLIVHNVLVGEARDAGTFSPGVAIQHELGLPEGRLPAPSAKLECVALRVKWSDGTYYKSPRIWTVTRLNAK